jgi:hypothetical protein
MWERVESGAHVSLAGALLWAMIAVLAGMRRAPFDAMELLFLFAVLVVVPLGLELAEALRPDLMGGMRATFRCLHAGAGLAVIVSFWLPPGRLAAALLVPWLALALGWALAGMAHWWRGRNRSLVGFAVAIAGVDLAFGSISIIVSRAGWRPLEFQEPIVLLTAIHYHYSGFATALIAAAALHRLQHHAVRVRKFRLVMWLVLALPYVLAAGFVFSPLLRMAAAVALALSMTVLAAANFWLSLHMENRTARFFLRAASCAAWIGMGLAGAYAVSDYAGRTFLTMPSMARTHGVLNSVGFVLFSMLAFLIELRARELDGQDSSKRTALSDSEAIPRKRPARAPQPAPEFVAREFYDR